MKLYQDLNGRIVCFDHIGAYAQAAFRRSPRSRRQETPMTVWQRMTNSEVENLEAYMSSEYGHVDYVVMCDDCSYQSRTSGSSSKESIK